MTRKTTDDTVLGAIQYVLHRVQTDPDLEYAMGWGTESFARLCAAEAELLGPLPEARGRPTYARSAGCTASRSVRGEHSEEAHPLRARGPRRSPRRTATRDAHARAASGWAMTSSRVPMPTRSAGA